MRTRTLGEGLQRAARESGYVVLQKLRERFGEQMPIVFVSGVRTESYDRAGGFLLGAYDYFVKPVDPGELLARMARLLIEKGPQLVCLAISDHWIDRCHAVAAYTTSNAWSRLPMLRTADRRCQC